MWLVSRFVSRLWRWYVERLVCLHFCRFKQAGSDLGYTHVHVLGKNDQGADGLGHDDHTPNDDPGHTTVSVGGNCRIQAEDERSMVLRETNYLATAHFHQGSRSEKCPPGYRKIKCKCTFAENEEDVLCVCYTLDDEARKTWHEAHVWPNQLGTYEVPYVGVTPGGHSAVPHSEELSCGSSLVLRGYAIDRVQNCDGFGPSDADNRLVKQVRADLQKVADKISCEADCQKSVTEIWRGWECKKDGPYVAHAMVQWKVECKKR